MYRVMIVDDEKAIRCLLRRTINWEEMNLRVEGEAASGIEAINIIDEIRPDIIFVDIRMPFMNGIDEICNQEISEIKNHYTYCI